MSADPDKEIIVKIRMTAGEWERFDRAARSVYGEEGRPPRSRAVRELMRWYMREPGTKQFQRPAVGPWSDPGGEGSPSK